MLRFTFLCIFFTAGNSSQTSDEAAFVLLMSEKMVKELNLKPIAKMVSYALAGVEPRIMGMGPVAAIPKALKMANLKKDDIDLIELNEAFAAHWLLCASWICPNGNSKSISLLSKNA